MQPAAQPRPRTSSLLDALYTTSMMRALRAQACGAASNAWYCGGWDACMQAAHRAIASRPVAASTTATTTAAAHAPQSPTRSCPSPGAGPGTLSSPRARGRGAQPRWRRAWSWRAGGPARTCGRAGGVLWGHRAHAATSMRTAPHTHARLAAACPASCCCPMLPHIQQQQLHASMRGLRLQAGRRGRARMHALLLLAPCLLPATRGTPLVLRVTGDTCAHAGGEGDGSGQAMRGLAAWGGHGGGRGVLQGQQRARCAAPRTHGARLLAGR